MTRKSNGLAGYQADQVKTTIEWLNEMDATGSRGGYIDAVRLYDPEIAEHFGWVVWVGTEDWRYVENLPE
jgi:hypothetical protein